MALTLTRPTFEPLLPGGANAYPAYGLSRCCRVALTPTRPTFEPLLPGGANAYPAYGLSRCRPGKA
ncbi:MAG: hypothetical protein ACLTYF_16315 [Escherichia sp.]|uniref:hypothetical protein n=1 Tax=Enterobacter hormaechei TaxID=158836 RepID=UPI000A6597E5|nr:hypothetical protein [Enterobacter hormaechei]